MFKRKRVLRRVFEWGSVLRRKCFKEKVFQGKSGLRKKVFKIAGVKGNVI